jgi:hypothetical protein
MISCFWCGAFFRPLYKFLEWTYEDGMLVGVYIIFFSLRTVEGGAEKSFILKHTYRSDILNRYM